MCYNTHYHAVGVILLFKYYYYYYYYFVLEEEYEDFMQVNVLNLSQYKSYSGLKIGLIFLNNKDIYYFLLILQCHPDTFY